MMISQASSEHSICFAVPQVAGARRQRGGGARLFCRAAPGTHSDHRYQRDNCILAVVGDGMAGIPGVASEFFGALGKANVNIRAIAQGSSERNISAVIDQRTPRGLSGPSTRAFTCRSRPSRWVSSAPAMWVARCWISSAYRSSGCVKTV